jgi:hypothetical protein
MEKPTVSRTNLSGVIVIMTIMCIAMAMSGGDGIDSGTRVPITRCMWTPVATSYPLPEDPAPVALSDTGKTHGHDCRGPECTPSRVMRKNYIKRTGDEIMFICGYQGEREDKYRFHSGLVLFRFVVPPLQSGGVRPFLVWGAWFPSHLPLKGTELYPEFWAIIGDPRYPGYKTLTRADQVLFEELKMECPLC